MGVHSTTSSTFNERNEKIRRGRRGTQGYHPARVIALRHPKTIAPVLLRLGPRRVSESGTESTTHVLATSLKRASLGQMSKERALNHAEPDCDCQWRNDVPHQHVLTGARSVSTSITSGEQLPMVDRNQGLQHAGTSSQHG